ncbi:8-amino-7-oxononanoate synthase [Pseudoalteromonas sp. BDTF-M6]|uniref:aminotransferase class I/II-fold pyridoxal phosphate-dependent enzyme n=1 Tax=Pseudoalteromonas sp. BDTF-M6 TaxID=2796132 RepID=UPI001BAF3C13|nr:8-amino-7-oxononanoate synthase [Pseudoalteromonas sp. BDTF-M6]MBS3796798.1 8-amino-7-oxononanoate synthase [Pseudoalteromonas sp. BDTF-M6]
MAFDYIQDALNARRQQHLLRRRVLVEEVSARSIRVQGSDYLNFASNDYLALGDLPLNELEARSGSHSSPLVTGYQRCHQALEKRFCDLLGYQSAMLFPSGFSANISVLKALFAESNDGLIVQDKLNHASLIDGGLQANAAMQRFNHNNMSHLQARLTKSKARNKLVVSEGVFSMDGDCAPVGEIDALCRAHDAWFMLDDAHGFGVLGDGLGSALERKTRPDILVITFGKALASNGAVVLASTSVIELLLQGNRDYIYSTSISPMQCAITEQRLTQLLDANVQRQQLQRNITYFRERCAQSSLALMESQTPIQPLIVGDSESALQMQTDLREQGIWLSAIRPPTVAHNTARLRITLTAAHQERDIDTLVKALESCR